jgi:hypothetical protein
MRLIEPAGRPYIECPKCKACVVLPSASTEEQRIEFASIARTDPIEAIRHARDVFNLDIREAKALTLHVTLQIGKCHRCKTPVTDKQSVCAKCRSANLDW